MPSNTASAHIIQQDVTTIILAGGEGRRLKGQDKGLIKIHGRSLVAHALDTFSPITTQVIISANRNIEDYKSYGFPVITDNGPCYQGPLAGISSCLNATQTPYAFVVACDMPSVPASIIKRLYTGLKTQQGAQIALAHDGIRSQPLCLLLSSQLKSSLKQTLKRKELKVLRWINDQNSVTVDCSDIKDSFKNINTTTDLAQAT